MSRSWIGVDLDGTLAHYERFISPTHIGKPIQPMVDRVKRWIANGYEVRIFTARASHPNQGPDCVKAIKAWCIEHIGRELEVTCTKDYAMIELWDDRCVQVVANTGMPIGGDTSTRGLR